MTEFSSITKIVSCSQTKVYAVLSDLSNLEKIKDRIPTHQVNDFAFDRDSVSFSVSPVGKIKITIVERTPPTDVRFAAEQSPIDMHLHLHLQAIGEQETALKLTVYAQLNPFIKPLLSKPVQEGIDKIADTLAMIPYNEI